MFYIQLWAPLPSPFEQLRPPYRSLYVVLAKHDPVALAMWAVRTTLYITIFCLLHPPPVPWLLWVVNTSPHLWLTTSDPCVFIAKAVVGSPGSHVCNHPASPHHHCRPHFPTKSHPSPHQSNYTWPSCFPITLISDRQLQDSYTASSNVTFTHLQMRHQRMESRHAWFSNQLLWLDKVN